MALLEKHTEPDCLWGIWKIEETVDDLLLSFSHPESYELAMAHLVASSRRLEWLAVRALLLELSGEEKQIAYHANGMPYLLDGSAFISISHTRGYVAVVLSTERPMGIDIEQYGDKILRLANKFMTDDELEHVDAESDIYHLLLHWSAKETIFKILGEQAIDFKEHLCIYPFTVEEKGSFEAQEFKTPLQRKFTIFYRTDADFVLTRA